MTQGIKDKVVVVTGASSGLGEAAARHLAQRGETGAGRRRWNDFSAGQRALAGGRRRGADGCNSSGRAKRLVAHAAKSHGRIDVIINNAGLMPNSLLEHLKIDEWDRMIDVNIKGVLYGDRRGAAPHDEAKKRTLHQRLFRRRPQGGARWHDLFGDRMRSARDRGRPRGKTSSPIIFETTIRRCAGLGLDQMLSRRVKIEPAATHWRERERPGIRRTTPGSKGDPSVARHRANVGYPRLGEFIAEQAAWAESDRQRRDGPATPPSTRSTV